jgi:hypothetical protein
VCATVDGLFFTWVLKPALRKMYKKEEVVEEVVEVKRQMSVAKAPQEVRSLDPMSIDADDAHQSLGSA